MCKSFLKIRCKIFSKKKCLPTLCGPKTWQTFFLCLYLWYKLMDIAYLAIFVANVPPGPKLARAPTRQCSLCGFVFACAFNNLFGASVTLINLLAMFCLNCYGFPCLANGSLLGAPYFQRAAKPSEKCHDKWVCFHMVKFLVPMHFWFFWFFWKFRKRILMFLEFLAN